MDARQNPVLSLFAVTGDTALPWTTVRAVALENGYQMKGVGGLLTALLEWADAGKTMVRITTAGQQRLAEIIARLKAAA
jgi:hypothetical protein